MTKRAARELLRRLERRYGDWIRWRDSRFVFGQLLPALRTLDRRLRSPRDGVLLALGYNFVGDLWDFLDAPRAAARAYRAAVRCDPRNRWAWEELGHMLLNIGQYRAALRTLRRAEALPGDDFMLEHHLEGATEGIRDRGVPRFSGGARHGWPAPSWNACELLARNRPRAALRLLREKRHPYLRQLRARAHGALGDTARFIDEWEDIASTKGDVELEHGDWFYLPGGAWDDPRFWRALYALRRRYLHGWSSMHEYMWKIVPETKRHRRDSKAYVQRHRRRMALWLRFHIARTERDAAAAGRLVRRYPGWRRAGTLARKLTSRTR